MTPGANPSFTAVCHLRGFNHQTQKAESQVLRDLCGRNRRRTLRRSPPSGSRGSEGPQTLSSAGALPDVRQQDAVNVSDTHCRDFPSL